MPRTQLMHASKLGKLIVAIGGSRVALDANIQIAAVQCIAQSIVHRNSSPAADLYEALSKTTRREGLIAYFEKFGNLMWSKQDKKVAFFDRAKVMDEPELAWTPEYQELVEGTVWHSTIKETEPRSKYDLQEEFDKVLDRLTKIANKPGNEVKHKGLVDVLSKAFLKYQYEEFEKETKIDLTAEDREFLKAEAEAKAKNQDPADAIPSTERLTELADHFRGEAQLKAA